MRLSQPVKVTIANTAVNSVISASFETFVMVLSFFALGSGN